MQRLDVRPMPPRVRHETSFERVMVALDTRVADLHCTHRRSTGPDRTPDV